MTGTRKKLRSLFLTALMIGSVFAGTVALSGTAAAATNTSYTLTADGADRYLTSTTGNTYQTSGAVEISSAPSSVTTEILIEDAELANVDSNADVQVQINGGGFTNVGTSNYDVTGDTITVQTSNLAVPSDGDQVTFRIQDVTNPDEAGTYDFEVSHLDGDDEEFDGYREVTKIADTNLGNNRTWQGQTIHTEQGTGTYELYEVTRDSNGNRIITSNNYIRTLSFDSAGVANIDTSSLEGEYAIATTGQNPYNIDSLTRGQLPNTDGGSSVDAVDTFTVTVQDLSATFDETEVETGESTDLEFESNRNNFEVDISADGLSEGDLQDIFGVPDSAVDEDDNEVRVTVSGDQISTADFSGIDQGDYTFNADVVDTAAEASASVSVIEESDIDATIANGGTARAAEGDIAVIPIQMENTEEVTVNLGYNNVGFNLTATVEDGDDDGEVVLQPNLYNLGRTGLNSYAQANIGTEDDSDSVEVTRVEQISDAPLDPAAYDLNVTEADTPSNELAVGTLQIVGSNTQQIRSWTAPASEWGEFDDDEEEEIYNLVSEGALTQSNSVAQDDVLVYQIQTTSVFGALETEEAYVSTNDYSEAFAHLTNTTSPATGTHPDYNFTIEQTNPDANRDGKEILIESSESADALQVVPDQANSSVFVLIDTEDAVVTRAGNSAELKDGDEYEANFTISEASNIVDESVSVLDTASIVEKSLSFETGADDTIRVEAAANQTVAGTTTVAPGTELNLRIRSTGTSPFLEDPTAIVQPDGSFTTAVDFSNRAENTTFEASARGFDVETPGVIGSAPTASVVFDDQDVTDSTVTVQSVTMSNGGFVAIHQGSASGEVIGSSEYLESGETTDVEIDVGELSEDQTLVAMPHQDTNDNEEYEFGEVEGADGPYITSGGAPVTDSANITIAEETTTQPPETTTEPVETTEPMETTEPSGETTEPSTETTTGSGPGFTAVLAVLAMLGAALLVARRRN